MSTLRVQFNGPYAPVATEILNDELETVYEGAIWRKTNVSVPPGLYFVRARLPSGEMLRGNTFVAENKVSKISLNPSSPPHRRLEWQHFLGNLPKHQEKLPPTSPDSTWLRWWAYNGNKWEPQPSFALNLQWYDKQMKTYIFKLDPSLSETSHSLLLCQIGGEAVPWRFVSVPLVMSPDDDRTSSSVDVLVQRSQVPTKRNGGLTIKIVGKDHKAETLLHYLAAGSLHAAQLISDEALSDVKQFRSFLDHVSARGKKRATTWPYNPLSLVVGGYYLLRASKFERLRCWPNHFANQFQWLPDAAVIHAWQLLRQPGDPDPDLDLVRQRLLQAACAGVPIYTEGFRLLKDGLELFADEAKADNLRDEEVEQALKKLRPYAAAADWEQQQTTFYGATPHKPSPNLVTGVPSEEETLRLLPTE